MPEYDDVKSWINKLRKSIEEHISRNDLLENNIEISDSSDEREKSIWIKKALERLEKETTQAKCQSIMEKCSHVFPVDIYKHITEAYQNHKDINEALDLRHKLMVDLHKRAYKEGFWDVDEETIELIKQHRIVETGVLNDNGNIMVRKVPCASKEYHKAKNEEEKRYHYCHCYWLKYAIKNKIEISPLICHCGGGHYKHFWENVLQKEVEIILTKSIIKGDNECEFIIKI